MGRRRHRRNFSQLQRERDAGTKPEPKSKSFTEPECIAKPKPVTEPEPKRIAKPERLTEPEPIAKSDSSL